MIHHLAFDQSTNVTGWAYMPPNTKHYASGTLDMFGCNYEIIAVMDMAYRDGLRHMTLEGIFHGLNPQTTIKLAALQERFTMWGEAQGFRVRIIQPSTWKSAMLTVSGYFPPKRKEQKDVSVWVARQCYGMQSHSEDEADAILMAAWADKNPEMEG
jgi:hypothetical protein